MQHTERSKQTEFLYNWTFFSDSCLYILWFVIMLQRYIIYTFA